MKRLLSLAPVFLFIGMSTMTLSGSQHRDVDNAGRDRFVGGWRLARLTVPGCLSTLATATCRSR
jgi:hypothetical protein